jgi:hypothetical protein
MSVSPKVDIQKHIDIYKQNAYEIKKKLFSYLEEYSITQEGTEKGTSINDYITRKFLDLENSDEENNHFFKKDDEKIRTYTYWTNGGSSWYYWYNKNLKKVATDEEIVSMTISNLKFNYIFNDLAKWYSKTEALYYFVLEVQKELAEKGIYTDFETTNIDVNEAAVTGKFEILYEKKITKEPYCNIKLILNTNKGGGKKQSKTLGILRRERTKTIRGKERKEREEQKEQKETKKFKKGIKDVIENFDEKDLKMLNGKILLEFQLEYLHPFDENNQLINDPFNMVKFEKYYIDKEFGKSTTTMSNENIRLFLNRLNLNGLITYSYLSSSKTEVETGLNVEKIRQDLLLKKISNKKKIVEVLTKVKNNYEHFFKKYNSYNSYFIEKINDVILEHKVYKYSYFIDMVDRYLMSLFRKSLNSFMKELNEELERKFNVKLFISGGDAMRRYDYDISFTSDIDTKLHIEGMTEENKRDIMDIIMSHIVKLRNYLEDNKRKVLEELKISENDGIDVFRYKLNPNSFVRINILLEPEERDKNQQFRTRQIKKNETFPVDLYSLDFRYDITFEEDGKKSKYKHQLSILDVVIIDSKKYNKKDFEETNGIAYASKNFLLKDIKETYNNESLTLARLSNGKTNKDIKRYQELSRVKSEFSPSKYSYLNHLEELRIPNELKEVLNKIKNGERITIFDYTQLNNINDKELKPLQETNPKIFKLIYDIIDHKINIPNEDLNELDNDYNSYVPDDTNMISKNYNMAFKNLTDLNDGLFKHVMSYSNKSIQFIYDKDFSAFEYYERKFRERKMKKDKMKQKEIQGEPLPPVASAPPASAPIAPYNPSTPFVSRRIASAPLPVSSPSPSPSSTSSRSRSSRSTPYSARTPSPVLLSPSPRYFPRTPTPPPRRYPQSQKRSITRQTSSTPEK